MALEPTVFAFHPPPQKPTPLEVRLERILASGEITRSISTSRIPPKKIKDALHPTVSSPQRTLATTPQLFIGPPAAFKLRPNTVPDRKSGSITERKAIKADLDQMDQEVKRVFRPEYNWPSPYAKDRDVRACPTDSLTTVLFGRNSAVGIEKKEKGKVKGKGEKKTESRMEIQGQEKMKELPMYSEQRSKSLHDIRLVEKIRKKVAVKVAGWKKEVADIIQHKRKNIQEEQQKLKECALDSENDKIIQEFETLKAKFELQRTEVKAIIKEIHGDDSEESEPILPAARYPQSKRVLKAQEDVQTWFQTKVVGKHKPVVTSEPWKTLRPLEKLKGKEIDPLYITEVQPTQAAPPVRYKPSTAEAVRKPLEIEFRTPEDSFEEVEGQSELHSAEDSFEEVP